MAALASVGSIVSSLLALQVAQALLTAFVFWAFHRRFGNPVLAYWTTSWMALAGQLVGLGATVLLAARGVPPTGLGSTLLVAFTLACAYLQVAWLLLGAFALALGRDVRPRMARTVVAWNTALAVVSCVPFATTEGASAARFLARTGAFGVITGIARLAAGIAIWRLTFQRRDAAPITPARADPALGQRLVATAVALLGAFALLSAARGIVHPPTTDIPAIVPGLTEARLLLNFALGLGLVIWLLEVEQRRTLDSAQRAEHMAYHDPLTGLPNRLLLIDRLRLLIAHARRAHESFAVFFLDVDHFKAVNDSFGHAAGDRLLQQIAARLTAQLREADTVARLGGDEFVVLTPELKAGPDVTAVAEKLLEAVRAPIMLDEREIRATVSIGVSLFPDDGEDADALLRGSDAALYRAKEEGRDAMRLA